MKLSSVPIREKKNFLEEGFGRGVGGGFPGQHSADRTCRQLLEKPSEKSVVKSELMGIVQKGVSLDESSSARINGGPKDDASRRMPHQWPPI